MNTMAKPIGDTIPPPKPWMMRKTINCSGVCATAHNTEPIVNNAIVIRKMRFSPNLSVIQPASGMTADKASV
ncbi:hypothetical protein D3C76_1599470 [compost metagenome]